MIQLVVGRSFYKRLKELGWVMNYYVKDEPLPELSAEVLLKYATATSEHKAYKLASPKKLKEK